MTFCVCLMTKSWLMHNFFRKKSRTIVWVSTKTWLPIYAKKPRKKFSGRHFCPVFPSIKVRKSDSPFLTGEFCRLREKGSGHLSCFIYIRTGLKIPFLEYVSKPFVAVLMQISAGSTRAFEVKTDLMPEKSEKRRLALYLRYMVVLGESARILRLSSIVWVGASTQKRRSSAETGPGRLRESAK